LPRIFAAPFARHRAVLAEITALPPPICAAAMVHLCCPCARSAAPHAVDGLLPEWKTKAAADGDLDISPRGVRFWLVEYVCRAIHSSDPVVAASVYDSLPDKPDSLAVTDTSLLFLSALCVDDFGKNLTQRTDSPEKKTCERISRGQNGSARAAIKKSSATHQKLICMSERAIYDRFSASERHDSMCPPRAL